MRIRKEEDVEKKKAEILAAAEELLKEEGLDQLSMRKVAERIHMTPGILYHYYENKEALLMEIVRNGYQEILQLIQKSDVKGKQPDEAIYTVFYAYIGGMLERRELYTMLMNAQYPGISSQTAMLYEGISKERSSIQSLCQQIERGKQQGLYVCEHVELRAQCIWCGVYGLLDRIIKEKVDGQQQERLIREQLHMLIGSLRYVK